MAACVLSASLDYSHRDRATTRGALILSFQEFLADKEPDIVMANLRDVVTDDLSLRPNPIDRARLVGAKPRQPESRRPAEAIAKAMRNQRLQ